MIYSREFLENLAERINKKYFPERLDSPSVLNCYDLLEAVVVTMSGNMFHRMTASWE